MRRNLCIDALRGLSILLVVMLHSGLRLPLQQSLPFRVAPEVVWTFLCRNGGNGVRIFFVISGFLITSTSIARWGALERVAVRRFYQLRFARIAPPLLVLLVVLSALHLLQAQRCTIEPAQASLGRALLAALALHLNWLEGQVGYLPPSWDVLWSLSVEEAFYLFFPLACLALRHPLGQRAVVGLLGVLIAAGPVFRALEENEIWRSKAYLACFDLIAIGCVAALLARRLPLGRLGRRVRRLCAGLGGALTISVLALDRDPAFHLLDRFGVNRTLLALGVALLLIALGRAVERGRDPVRDVERACDLEASPDADGHLSIPRWLVIALRPLAAYGCLSYEIYLTHMFVVLLAVAKFERHALPADATPALVAVVLAASWGLGALVERYISLPSNRRLRATVAAAAVLGGPVTR